MTTKTRLKAVPPKTAEPSKPKILIYGKPGVGKTWTSLDFPKVYYIDTEGGANRNHYTDKLEKAGGVYMGVDEGSQIFETVIDQIQGLASEKHGFKTVVIDSITKLFNIEIAKEADRLGDKDAFGASKKPAIALTRKLVSWVDRLDMNVILIAHEKPLWANGEQAGVTYDAWEKLEYELDLSLNIAKTGESRKAYIKKSRLTGFPDATNFIWSYTEFAQRYGKDIIEKESKPLDLATEDQLGEVKRLLNIVKLSDSMQDKWIAENASTLNEVDAERVEKIITHLKGKVA